MFILLPTLSWLRDFITRTVSVSSTIKSLFRVINIRFSITFLLQILNTHVKLPLGLYHIKSTTLGQDCHLSEMTVQTETSRVPRVWPKPYLIRYIELVTWEWSLGKLIFLSRKTDHAHCYRSTMRRPTSKPVATSHRTFRIHPRTQGGAKLV